MKKTWFVTVLVGALSLSGFAQTAGAADPQSRPQTSEDAELGYDGGFVLRGLISARSQLEGSHLWVQSGLGVQYRFQTQSFGLVPRLALGVSSLFAGISTVGFDNRTPTAAVYDFGVRFDRLQLKAETEDLKVFRYVLVLSVPTPERDR